GITWTATLTPGAGVENDTNLITLDNTGYVDGAGNLGTGTTDSNNYTIDTQRPTATVVVADIQLRAGETSVVTITFTEAITGLAIDDFIVQNGSISGLSSSDGGITWTVTLTPDSGVADATNVITLDNAGYADQAGNTGTGTTNSNNYAIDTQLPTAIVVVADTQLSIGETSLVTITFSEPIAGLAIDDFTVQNGSISDLSTSDGGITWTVTLTPDSGVEDATNLISLNNTGYVDQGGNAGIGVSNSNNYSIDTQLPSGYSVSILTDRINGVNQNNFRFRLIDGEIGADFSYTITSSAGGTPITGIGEVTNSDQFISGIVVEDLPDGELTLTVTLTDESGNEGLPVSDTVEKLLPAQLTIRVVQEADEEGNDGLFEITTDNTFAANTTVTLEIGGTATSGVDYMSIGVELLFPGNTSTVSIPVSVIDDLDVEGDETVIIRLVSTNNSLVTIGEPSEATMTIADNDVPRQLTITPDANQQKVYGDEDPTTLSYTASGFELGDDDTIIQGSLTRQAGEDAGTYSYTLGNLDAGPNYELVLNPEVFTITPATLTIEVDELEKVYGDTDPDFAYTATGFRRDDITGILSGTFGRTAGENVGTYAFNLGTLSAGANYNLQLISTTPFLISPAPLRLIADDKQKIFNTTNPPLTFTYDGLVNGDTQIQTLPTIVTTATETSPAGTYPIILNGGSDSNYSISRVEGTLTIGQKAVTITANNQSKVYGQANPVLTFSYEGLLEGDTQIQTEPSISTEATISSNVGSYEITLSGGSDPNYDFTLVNGTLSVTPATLTITADDQSKVYGQANPPLTFSYAGLVNGDSGIAVEPSITSAASANSNVGTYDVTLTGGSDPNYAITRVNGTLTVTPADLTITADDQSKIYGAANPTLTFTYLGLVNGDTQVATEPSITTTATSSSNVGTYPITLSGGLDANYDITLVNGTLTVGQKAVTITAENQSKVYGEENPTLTFTYTGLVNGDEKVATEPSIATTATESSNVGSHPITLSGGVDANYAITLVNGTLTVGQKAVTITAEDKSKIYGEANPALTFTYTGLVNGDTQVATEPSIATSATASSNVGTYPITLSGGIDANYNITLVDGELEVTQATLTITANEGQSKIFGTADPVLSYFATGFAAGDDEQVLTGNLTRATGEVVGTYPINLGSLAAGGNYQIVYTSADFEIIPAVIEAVMQPAPIETVWGVYPGLPSTVTVMTTDGQFLALPITWDLQTLYVFGNGEYPLTASINLPSGILNTEALTVEIVVTVLPKPAPEDILLDNNSFEADAGLNFIAVGNLTVIDPIDNQHDISLADLAFDNVYFQINNGTLFWNSVERADGRTEFKILVRVQDRDGNILEKEFTIIRNRTSVSNIEIFNSFTPDGDNVNDTWGIKELRFYKGVRIQIFERSGKRLFYTENPDVRWDGTFNSTDMPTGTYYWTVEVGETGEVRKGMLNLIRK
ncbi:MBG domain-containing protein, partial [Belliella aquatica]|uniref:MBG domain-containing protein n=2 Tax=Belliella aquatica TaxID=1323734 RepID=UPI001887E80D